MPIDSTRPEYKQASTRWDLVNSVVKNDAKHLIRVVDPADPLRSQQYRDDAILTNFTALTLVGLTGLVFQKEPEQTIPSELDYLNTDATGDNLSLDQLAQKITQKVLSTGRFGVLVDYPSTVENISANMQEVAGIRAYIKPYCAEAIINWQYKTYGGKCLLSMLVLKEMIDDVGEDGFEWVQKVQYRLLYLDDVQQYHQRLYNEEFEIVSDVMPIDGFGQVFNEIPFTFIGSENNDAAIDMIPLYDMSVLNLGHYRNSADLEESGHVCGQPTIFMSVAGSQEEFKQAYPNGIRFGSRAGYNLGEGGTAQLLQANPNQLIAQMMKQKEEMAAAIGARLIAQSGGRETAEAAKLRYASQHSALYVITKNISAALEQAIAWVARYMRVAETEIEYELNDQFYDETADPQLIAQQMMLLDRGVMNVPELRTQLAKHGIIEEEDIELITEIDPLVDSYVANE